MLELVVSLATASHSKRSAALNFGGGVREVDVRRREVLCRPYVFVFGLVC